MHLSRIHLGCGSRFAVLRFCVSAFWLLLFSVFGVRCSSLVRIDSGPRDPFVVGWPVCCESPVWAEVLLSVCLWVKNDDGVNYYN